MIRLLSCFNHEGHEGNEDLRRDSRSYRDIDSTRWPAKQAADAERHVDRFANFVFFVIFVVKPSVFFAVPRAA